MSQFTETLNAVASEFDVDTEAAPHRKPRPSKRPYFRWTEEMTEKLVDLVDQQKTAEEIAVELCVPLDRVKSKLATLKAKVPSVKPPKAKPEPLELMLVEPKEPETHEETHEETHAEPPIALDRVIFRAFDELVGRVDDFDRMAANWRCALTLMESYLRDQFGTIRSCPDTAKHFAAIAAILAQSEINA